MVVTVKIISKEIVKPSSPTPLDLETHKLSFLDKILPNVYIPIILVYHAKTGHVDIDPAQKSSRLKLSLGKILTRFYPLAGTAKYDYSVLCNDEGAEYYEARVSCNLSEVLLTFNAEIFNQFLPFEPYGNGAEHGNRKVMLAVKYNIFDCGGVAIGICVSHLVADGTSVTTFLNAWSAMCQGDDGSICPNFDATTYFPQRDMSWLNRDEVITKDKTVMRRLVFNKSSIAALREKASSAADSQVKLPTRVEALTAFIWRRLIAISKSSVCAVVHAVNLRERMDPPIPKHCFGNLWFFAAAVLSRDEVDHDSSDRILVSKLNKALEGINGDYVKKLQNDVHGDLLKKAFGEFARDDMETCNFTSWCRFPLYEADFGWGKPTWVCCPSLPIKNVVVMTSTKDGHGIEAFVNILEEDAAVFDSDPELLPFVSLTIAHD
ncbi:Vinorine synthase [Morella rubra]|uniref:Vinorine synthase n=1 Tax=Morella rubra TaxID=262757 RepID=A0A6A1VZ24_9ROSI|nr:Vinorine synthase [Morella rubra]